MTNKTKCLSAAALAMTVASAHGAEQADPYLWLEDVESKDALEWVKKHNGQTDAYLEKKSQYDAFYDDSLAVLNAQDRLAYPTRRGTFYYNFWQDDTHVKGIYRRTSAQSYAQKAPEWETVIDIDALAQHEQKDWVLKGVDCYAPDYQRCMVALSLGGADATVKREFDMVDKAFVHDGFTLPEAKSGTTWLDHDHLLVATDFGPDSLTDSGYPRTIKQWQRGTPLSEATTLYQGATDSVSVSTMTLRDSHSRVTLIAEGMTFYSQKLFWLNADDLVPLALPADSEVMGYFEGQLFFQLKSDYRQGERTFPQGSVVYASMTELAKPTPGYQLLVKPTASASIEALDVTAEYLVVSWLNDVTSQIQLFRPQDTGQWHTQTVAIEDNATLSVFNATPEHHDFFVDVASFLIPPSIYQVTPERQDPRVIKSTKAKFNADDLQVTQQFATSKDGTAIPYFIVAKKSLDLDQSHPTLLYGYGGFEVSLTPHYSAVTGKNWLEKGGVYVLANIRGGGEYGPAWHQAALKDQRHKAYEDFEAVAEALIASKITSPAHLGIQGGSNGGLLVGATAMRRPDLYNAVVCQVPLLDMRRFNQLLAGASWMAEYGNPDNDADWAYIRTYSPYHNIKAETAYPRIFFTTSTRDDRVHPGHARKMVAKMQEMGHDVLYFENMEGGHAGASNNTTRAKMLARTYTYLADQLGME